MGTRLSLVKDRGPIRWAEISNHCERERFTALSQALNEQRLENEVSFIETEATELQNVLDEAFLKYDQIRVGGSFCEEVLRTLHHQPSTLLTIRSADALVKENGQWWPRCFLVDGMLQTVATNLTTLDLSGAVFILGVTAETRAVVAALVIFPRRDLAAPS